MKDYVVKVVTYGTEDGPVLKVTIVSYKSQASLQHLKMTCLAYLT